jgi:hypothetical protein
MKIVTLIIGFPDGSTQKDEFNLDDKCTVALEVRTADQVSVLPNEEVVSNGSSAG